jgi:hypothetical protein
MSSHHIVREKQEPALYIHHLGAFDEEYLGQLLEWSPTLIVNSTEFEKVISLGLKIDMVVNPIHTLAFQENTKVIDIGGNDLNSVLAYLISEGYPAVNVINANGELIDLDPYISQINIVLFSNTHKTYSIRSGFKVWKPAQSIFLLTESQSVTFSNLVHSNDHEFEVAHDGFVAFNFSGPYIFISEKL